MNTLSCCSHSQGSQAFSDFAPLNQLLTVIGLIVDDQAVSSDICDAGIIEDGYVVGYVTGNAEYVPEGQRGIDIDCRRHQNQISTSKRSRGLWAEAEGESHCGNCRLECC